MIRWSIYVFVAVSLFNFGQKLLEKDLVHLGVAATLVFMSMAALIMSLDD
jgi:hypothetical protein